MEDDPFNEAARKAAADLDIDKELERMNARLKVDEGYDIVRIPRPSGVEDKGH